jgi:predicted DCC family thiol-disulfide oxidoreductase YuxK
VPHFPDDRPIVVFDGQCMLCSRMMRFLLTNDQSRRLRFVTAQSPLGAALYAHYGKAAGDYETHMLIEDGAASFKSDAAIAMLAHCGAPWSLAKAGRIVPRAWRDAFYDSLARHRIAWFGARQICYAPSAQDADRFLA